MALQLNLITRKEDAAYMLAATVSRDLQQALANSATGRALLLLSGGTSPLPFFSALAQQPLPWDRIDVSPVDERSVPFSHADSNAGLIAQHVLQGPARAARLLPLLDDAQKNDDAWRWAKASAVAANANPELTTPAVIVLGLGIDGHTASLFDDAPQWAHACATDQRYVAIQPQRAPHARISLSLHALIAQRDCYVWSGGADKLRVIRQAQLLKEQHVDAATVNRAGPLAMLIADPAVTLRVFHNEH